MALIMYGGASPLLSLEYIARALPIWDRFEIQTVLFAEDLTRVRTDTINAAIIATIASTTSISVNVKACLKRV